MVYTSIYIGLLFTFSMNLVLFFKNKGLTHSVRFTSSKLFGRYCSLYLPLHFCLLLESGNTINIPKLKLDLLTSLRICLLFLIASVLLQSPQLLSFIEAHGALAWTITQC